MGYEYCTLCPRECRVDRTAGKTGFCGCPDIALVANKCNIGQGYREIPSLEKGVDYSEYAVEVAKRRNGWEFEALLKKN